MYLLDIEDIKKKNKILQLNWKAKTRNCVITVCEA